MQKFNTLATGILSGFILPVIVYFILYYSKIQDVRFTLFSHNLVIGNIIPIIISHCIFPNLIIFFIFNGLGWTRATKGVLIITVILTAVVFGIKLIFSII